MHCPNCGHETSAELKFCRSCGMKLDSVARAVTQHLDADSPNSAAERDNEGIARSRPFPAVFVGIVIMFIGVVIGVAGQGIWGAKTAAVIIALLGMLMTIHRVLPAAARYDRELLRSAGKKEMPRNEPELNLTAGDDFQPAQSVTEGTTRNLDENKTKVLR